MTTPKAAILKSMKTRVDTARVYDHYIHVITNLEPDDPVCKSLKRHGVKSLPDLLEMNRDEIKTLKYVTASGNNTPLH